MKYKETFVDISTQRIRHDKMFLVLSILTVVIWLFRYSLFFGTWFDFIPSLESCSNIIYGRPSEMIYVSYPYTKSLSISAICNKIKPGSHGEFPKHTHSPLE